MKQIIFSLILLFGLAACADKVSYHPGWVTKEVIGGLEPETAFVLVEREDQTFLPGMEQGQRTRISAGLVKRDDQGRYQVLLPDETQRVSLLFIARGYQTHRISFDRTLGVGAYEYDVSLKPDPNWKRGFYLSLRPFLQGFITEPRYKMPAEQQFFLGQWLNESEDLLK